jgi:hypothetical protein
VTEQGGGTLPANVVQFGVAEATGTLPLVTDCGASSPAGVESSGGPGNDLAVQEVVSG